MGRAGPLSGKLMDAVCTVDVCELYADGRQAISANGVAGQQPATSGCKGLQEQPLSWNTRSQADLRRWTRSRQLRLGAVRLAASGGMVWHGTGQQQVDGVTQQGAGIEKAMDDGKWRPGIR